MTKKKLIKHGKAKNSNIRMIHSRDLPTKRNINLAVVGIEKMNYFILIPAVCVIIICALLFSKVAVVDRFISAGNAQQKASELQTQLDQTMEEMNSYEDISDSYKHYTYADMTSEELNMQDRMDAIQLINRTVLAQASISQWSIIGNQVNLTISGTSLQQLNQIASQLEKDDTVDFCDVNTATTDTDLSEDVTGQLTIYLVGATEGGENQ